MSFPQLVRSPRFSLEILLIREEELRCSADPSRRSRKRWDILDRRLLDVMDRVIFQSTSDFRALLPPKLQSPFTSQDLANALHQSRLLAQKMTYCLRWMGTIDVMGKRGNSLLYVPSTTSRT